MAFRNLTYQGVSVEKVETKSKKSHKEILTEVVEQAKDNYVLGEKEADSILQKLKDSKLTLAILGLALLFSLGTIYLVC